LLQIVAAVNDARIHQRRGFQSWSGGFSAVTAWMIASAARAESPGCLVVICEHLAARTRRAKAESAFPNHALFPPGKMPGSTSGRMPAATVNRHLALRIGCRVPTGTT